MGMLSRTMEVNLACCLLFGGEAPHLIGLISES